jgi:hypothetical protein
MKIELGDDDARAGEVFRAEGVLRRASQGDSSVLPALSALLDGHPEVWSRAGDLAAQALQAWVNLVAGEDLLLRESLARKLEALGLELLTPEASALEQVLVGRVIACHLQAEYADALAAQSYSANTAAQRLNLDRQESAQRRLLAAAAGPYLPCSPRGNGWADQWRTCDRRQASLAARHGASRTRRRAVCCVPPTDQGHRCLRGRPTASRCPGATLPPQGRAPRGRLCHSRLVTRCRSVDAEGH